MHERHRVDQITSVSFTKEQAKALQALAKARSWSVARTVRYAVDKTLAAAVEKSTGGTA